LLGSDVSAGRCNFSVVDDRLVLSGVLLIDDVEAFLSSAQTAVASSFNIIDISELTRMDTAGAWCILDHQASSEGQGHPTRIEGGTEAQRQLIETVAQNVAPTERGTLSGAGWSTQDAPHLSWYRSLGK
jgi:phospholipid/cholesterol/gamma-HCH transport system permease protein